MGTTDNSFWIRIQQGLNETGNLMAQKQYNMAMIKARQTLEYMVNYLGERALIVEGDLADSIDQLFEGRYISQSARDHYHRIRMLGNKAVHEGDDSPYDANEAFQLLSREINALAGSSGSGKHRTTSSVQRPTGVKAASVTSRSSSQRSSAPRSNSQRSGAPGNGGARTPVRTGERPGPSRGNGNRPSGARPGQRPPQRNSSGNGQKPSPRSRSRRRSKRRGLDGYGLLKPAIIFLVLLVLVMILVNLIPGKDDKKETTTPETPTELTTEAMSATEAPTEPVEPMTEAQKIYTTKSKLNVRSGPSTDSTRLGSLASGTVVEYVETYDDKWTVILFEGKQAYVATEFLTISEAETGTGTEDAGETTTAGDSGAATRQ